MNIEVILGLGASVNVFVVVFLCENWLYLFIHGNMLSTSASEPVRPFSCRLLWFCCRESPAFHFISYSLFVV